MYRLDEIANALTIRQELMDKFTFVGVLGMVSEEDGEKLVDILSDLQLIATQQKSPEWWARDPAWTNIEYEWVWA
jgi:hypothetical protein